MAAAVDSSTESVAVGVFASCWRVGRWRWRFMRRQRRQQWVCLSLAGESEAGGGSGSVDSDGGGSGCVGLVLASRRQAAVVDWSTEAAAVSVLESCWRAGRMQLRRIRRQRWRQWVCWESSWRVERSRRRRILRQRRRQWVCLSRAAESVAAGGGASVDRGSGSGQQWNRAGESEAGGGS